MPELVMVLGEGEATPTEIQQATRAFFLQLYGQPKSSSMNEARYNIFRSRKKPPPLKKLPPTDNNLALHGLRAHLQIQLWKAADKATPPAGANTITSHGWDITEGGDVMPHTSDLPVAPEQLLDIISCSCRAEGKACHQSSCSCKSAGLSLRTTVFVKQETTASIH